MSHSTKTVYTCIAHFIQLNVMCHALMYVNRGVMFWHFVSVDNEDLNGELDDVGNNSKNGLISNEFQQALSTHFDSGSHRDNKDIGKSRAVELHVVQMMPIYTNSTVQFSSVHFVTLLKLYIYKACNNAVCVVAFITFFCCKLNASYGCSFAC